MAKPQPNWTTWRRANPEEARAMKLAWNAANREKALEIQRKASKKWRAANPMKNAYQKHKARSGRRGIPFLLTFEQWASIWLESGKWDQRGGGMDRYCMARHNDVGPYAAGNIRICTNRENAADRRGGTTSRKGTPWTPRMREAIMAGRNKRHHSGFQN